MSFPVVNKSEHSVRRSFKPCTGPKGPALQRPRGPISAPKKHRANRRRAAGGDSLVTELQLVGGGWRILFRDRSA
jgi:hypothetical protein